MDALSEKKLSFLRRRLDQLGYYQPLGIESIPLVERLFADLVHTTDALKTMKLQATEQQRDQVAESPSASAEPYKTDNQKLIKEVNALHMELVRRKDAAEAQVTAIKSAHRRMEHENADLKFLNTQYAARAKILETELANQRTRIDRLNEMNLKAVVHTPTGEKVQMPTRKQRMDASSLVPPSKPRDAHLETVTVTESPYVCDLLKAAESKIASLEGEIEQLRHEKETVDTRFETMQGQVCCVSASTIFLLIDRLD